MEPNGFEFEHLIIKSEDKSLSEQDPEMIDNILIVKKEHIPIFDQHSKSPPETPLRSP